MIVKQTGVILEGRPVGTKTSKIPNSPWLPQSENEKHTVPPGDHWDDIKLMLYFIGQ
jgi:hypothetical protein